MAATHITMSVGQVDQKYTYGGFSAYKLKSKPNMSANHRNIARVKKYGSHNRTEVSKFNYMFVLSLSYLESDVRIRNIS